MTHVAPYPAGTVFAQPRDSRVTLARGYDYCARFRLSEKPTFTSRDLKVAKTAAQQVLGNIVRDPIGRA
jgi:hypothetical protein